LLASEFGFLAHFSFIFRHFPTGTFRNGNCNVLSICVLSANFAPKIEPISKKQFIHTHSGKALTIPLFSTLSDFHIWSFPSISPPDETPKNQWNHSMQNNG